MNSLPSFIVAIISGFILAFLSVPLTAFTFPVIFIFFKDASIYVSWISGALVASLLVVFPLGYFTVNSRPWRFGFLVGAISVLVLLGIQFIDRFTPGNLFFAEYGALFAFSGVASAVGFRVRRFADKAR